MDSEVIDQAAGDDSKSSKPNAAPAEGKVDSDSEAINKAIEEENTQQKQKQQVQLVNADSEAINNAGEE